MIEFEMIVLFSFVHRYAGRGENIAPLFVGLFSFKTIRKTDFFSLFSFPRRSLLFLSHHPPKHF